MQLMMLRGKEMKTDNQKDGEEAADHLSIAASGKG